MHDQGSGGRIREPTGGPTTLCVKPSHGSHESDGEGSKTRGKEDNSSSCVERKKLSLEERENSKVENQEVEDRIKKSIEKKGGSVSMFSEITTQSTPQIFNPNSKINHSNLFLDLLSEPKKWEINHEKFAEEIIKMFFVKSKDQVADFLLKAIMFKELNIIVQVRSRGFQDQT